MKAKLKVFLSTLVLLFFILTLSGCTSTKNEAKATSEPEKTVSDKDFTELGTGSTSFKLIVSFKDGSSHKYLIKTDKTTIGDALYELKLISGEQEGTSDIYVKVVDGVTADYDVDGSYWAFYINDEYANEGVGKTKIDSSKTYELRVEKM